MRRLYNLKEAFDLDMPSVVKVRRLHRPEHALLTCHACGVRTNLLYRCGVEDPLFVAAMKSKRLSGELCRQCFMTIPCGRGDHGKCATKSVAQVRGSNRGIK